jgi:hypothetical protein
MKDFTGKTLALGDTVAYPTHDRRQRAEMVIGKLVGTKLRYKRTYNYMDRKYTTHQVTTYQIRPSRRSRHESRAEGPITLWNTQNVLKVEESNNA